MLQTPCAKIMFYKLTSHRRATKKFSAKQRIGPLPRFNVFHPSSVHNTASASLQRKGGGGGGGGDHYIGSNGEQFSLVMIRCLNSDYHFDGHELEYQWGKSGQEKCQKS